MFFGDSIELAAQCHYLNQNRVRVTQDNTRKEQRKMRQRYGQAMYTAARILFSVSRKHAPSLVLINDAAARLAPPNKLTSSATSLLAR